MNDDWEEGLLVQFKELVLVAVTHISKLKFGTSREELKTRSGACDRLIYGPLCPGPNSIAVLHHVPFLEATSHGSADIS